MSIRVTDGKDKAVMYQGTSGDTIGKVYNAPGSRNASDELNEFVNEWTKDLNNNIADLQQEQRTALVTAFKVEKGFIDRSDFSEYVQEAERILNRRIYEDII
jgi:hypothetical protein